MASIRKVWESLIRRQKKIINALGGKKNQSTIVDQGKATKQRPQKQITAIYLTLFQMKQLSVNCLRIYLSPNTYTTCALRLLCQFLLFCQFWTHIHRYVSDPMHWQGLIDGWLNTYFLISVNFSQSLTLSLCRTEHVYRYIFSVSVPRK